MTNASVRLITGDCVEAMREMDAESIDSVVCDPPYGIGFMGKKWDEPGSFVERRAQTSNTFDHVGGNHNPTSSADSARTRRVEGRKFQEWCEDWATEAFRVLKPGGHLLAFGGTRTFHRLASAVEDAGFEVRDCLAWMFGSGFPKSLDVSKAIDKAAGVEREVVGYDASRARPNRTGRVMGDEEYDRSDNGATLTSPATDDAREWQGWGTALKPAFEPIVVARKPLIGTVAATVLAYGTGALNIDGCRVEFSGAADEQESKGKNQHADFGTEPGGNAVYGDYSMVERTNYDPPGRWPANVMLSHDPGCVQVGARSVRSDGHHPTTRPAGSDVAGASGHSGQDGLDERYSRGETVPVWDCVPDCPVRLLDAQSGVSKSSGGAGGGKLGASVYGAFANDTLAANAGGLGDSGGASRFFYCAKTGRAERNAGLGETLADARKTPAGNNHPTVKPIDVMRWLIRLVTPPGGTVLDPFLGSGTTGCAAALEGVSFVGVEREPDYMAIAEARIAFWAEHGEDGLRICAERDAIGRERRAVEDAGQLDLFALDA